MTTMTGAMLKVTLGGLGLPPRWFANKVGVTMRTVVRWFDGDGETVAPEVAEQVEKLASMTVDEMRKMVEKVGDTDTVTLVTYRTDKEFSNRRGLPASWHRALTFRVMDHLAAQGASVNVIYK